MRKDPDPTSIGERLADGVLAHTSRRGLLERAGAALIGLAGGAAIARAALPDDAEAYTNFCGHTWTTGNCPHPTGLPRVDARGLPLRARDGHAIDDLGRPVNAAGYVVNSHGHVVREADGEPIPRAPRTPICRKAGMEHDLHLEVDGSWYRCCGGRVRRLMDCCGFTAVRINGDESLTGYCYGGRHVYCVVYMETGTPC